MWTERNGRCQPVPGKAQPLSPLQGLAGPNSAPAGVPAHACPTHLRRKKRRACLGEGGRARNGHSWGCARLQASFHRHYLHLINLHQLHRYGLKMKQYTKVMQVALPRFKHSVMTPRRVRILPQRILSSLLFPPQKSKVSKGPTPFHRGDLPRCTHGWRIRAGSNLRTWLFP